MDSVSILIDSLQRMRQYAQERAPLKRNASVLDVANLASFLASEAASCITGQTIKGWQILPDRCIDSETSHCSGWRNERSIVIQLVIGDGYLAIWLFGYSQSIRAKLVILQLVKASVWT